MKGEILKISNGNGKNFGEGLQPKDIETIINRLGRDKSTIVADIER